MSIQVAVFQFKSVTVKVVADKISKDSTYLNGNDFVTLDENWLNKQGFLVWNAMPNKQTKVVEVIELKATSLSKLDSFVKSEDRWIDAKVKAIAMPSATLKILGKIIK